MISPAEAEAAIRERIPKTASETAPLAALAGAVLRETIVASRDQPPFDRVTMDGIAFASAASDAGRREFRIAGTQAAGARQMVLAAQDACFEVMTGAVLPLLSTKSETSSSATPSDTLARTLEASTERPTIRASGAAARS